MSLGKIFISYGCKHTNHIRKIIHLAYPNQVKVCDFLSSAVLYHNLSTSCCFFNMGKGKKHTKDSVQKVENSSPITLTKDGNVQIRILAKPGARESRVTDISSEGVGLQIAAPPVDGKANTELVKFLSSSLGVPKSHVTLDMGSKSRMKTVTVSSSSLQDVERILHSMTEK
ncbi:UPF0235 protein C15orf40 homolog [Palaemon carinicauda]|uniref:UPF0235 protein C15orf40 homolog n=1 Tax=Palaemon carinicauda TaxID=392227 RepID=UPI0035B5B05B